METETNVFGAARLAAEARLGNLGFLADSSRAAWSKVRRIAGRDLTLRISLPPQFPAALPVVFVDRTRLPFLCPHIEKSGKVCIAPDAALLLDISRPEDLIDDALAKATSVLAAGLTKTNQQDLVAEYSAYWPGKNDVVSMLHPSAAVARAHACTAKGPSGQQILCGDSHAALEVLLKQIGGQRLGRLSALFVPLRPGAEPPGFDARWTTREALEYIRVHAEPHTWDGLRSEFKTLRLPLLVVLGLRTAQDAADGLVAFEIPSATGAAREMATRGFRPEKVFAARELQFVEQERVAFHKVARRDRDYMIRRVGIPPELTSSTVTVIGCGAVGGHVALHVAALGVREIRLIDPDHMAPENVFRHALSAEDIDTKKVTALEKLLKRKYPELQILTSVDRVEDVAQRDMSLLRADVLVFATGDHGVEMAVNRLLPAAQPRLHVWVEPLGVGFHVLVAGLDSSACLECLYEPDEEHGLVNRHSIVAPGQNFTRTMAGCAGAFVPFSELDADRAAVEAAAMAGRVMLKRQTSGALLSYFDSSDDLLAQGFTLSALGRAKGPKTFASHTIASQAHCQRCGGQTR